MKLRMLIVLAGTLLAVSGCVVEPYGRGGGGYGYEHHDYDHHDYGRRVWRE